MLNDATCFKTVYIVCGYTGLRSGMDRLAALAEAQTGRSDRNVPVIFGIDISAKNGYNKSENKNL